VEFFGLGERCRLMRERYPTNNTCSKQRLSSGRRVDALNYGHPKLSIISGSTSPTRRGGRNFRLADKARLFRSG